MNFFLPGKGNLLKDLLCEGPAVVDEFCDNDIPLRLHLLHTPTQEPNRARRESIGRSKAAEQLGLRLTRSLHNAHLARPYL